MKQLKGGLRRCLPDHRATEGKAYAAFCAPFVERFGGRVPGHIAVALRELWRITGDLDALAGDVALARDHKRRLDERRMRRALNVARRDYTRLLASIDAAAAQQPGADWTVPRG